MRDINSYYRKNGVQYENTVCIIDDNNSVEPIITDRTAVGIDLGTIK